MFDNFWSNKRWSAYMFIKIYLYMFFIFKNSTKSKIA